MSRGRKGAFTLVEALVAVALTAIGVVSVLQGISAITHAESLMLEKERMQRLALDKLEELSGTNDVNTTSGDFTDRGEDRYTWSAALDPTGVENLDQLTVTVELSGGDREVSETVSGLIFQALAPQEPTQ